MVGVLLQIVLIVLGYYIGTRGILVATRRYSGQWQRRALVSLSFAVLFAPSVAGVGHGGLLPMPAWIVAGYYVSEGLREGALWWGVIPMLVTWVTFFGVATIWSFMSKNKNNKVDTNGNKP
jgi:hypothetical protein